MGALIPFAFDDQPIRVVEMFDVPWFVAADVCAALGLSKHRDAITKLDEDERGSVQVDTPGGQQEMAAINESGLYTLVLRCRDAMTPGTVPHRFRKWVTGEVLPALRRRGRYGPVDAVPEAPLDPVALTAMNGLVRTALKLAGPKAGRAVWDRLGLPSLAVPNCIAPARSEDRILLLLREAGPHGLVRTDLTRKTQWLDGDRERSRVLSQLLADGRITIEQQPTLSGRPRVIYRAS